MAVLSTSTGQQPPSTAATLRLHKATNLPGHEQARLHQGCVVCPSSPRPLQRSSEARRPSHKRDLSLASVHLVVVSGATLQEQDLVQHACAGREASTAQHSITQIALKPNNSGQCWHAHKLQQEQQPPLGVLALHSGVAVDSRCRGSVASPHIQMQQQQPHPSTRIGFSSNCAGCICCCSPPALPGSEQLQVL